MVHILQSDQEQRMTHTNNVTIGIPTDFETDIVYLQIAVDQQVYLSRIVFFIQFCNNFMRGLYDQAQI
jgi:hypothetical protein